MVWTTTLAPLSLGSASIPLLTIPAQRCVHVPGQRWSSWRSARPRRCVRGLPNRGGDPATL